MKDMVYEILANTIEDLRRKITDDAKYIRNSMTTQVTKTEIMRV